MKRKAPNITDALANAITTHTIQLLQVDAGLRRRITAMLKDIQRDIIRQLAQADLAGPRRPTFRERRLVALSQQIDATLRTGYRRIALAHEQEMRHIAAIESEYASLSVNRAVRADIMTVAVPETVLRELARTTLIEGAPSRDWWAGQSKALTQRFEREMRRGIVQGEGTDDLVRRVRGTKANDFTDGIMQTSRRDAEALVRTSVMAVSSAARMETFQANDDVVQGIQHVSTLDSRTTEICIALDGGAWDFEGNPLPDSPYQAPDPGPLPLHWNERSVRIPVLRSLSDIMGATGDRKASRLDALPTAMRASMDGQVAATLNFGDWLKGKEVDGPGFANDLLGRTRASLWRDGKLPLQRLIDQSGNPQTLEGLRSSVRGISQRAIDEARAA